jgi:hypothetical protein
MKVFRLIALLVAWQVGIGAWLCAAPPEQFRVWGAAGPELPTLPAGWTELRDVPEALPQLTPTPDEQRKGYVLFARDPMMLVGQDSIAAASERASQLKTFAALGEYEPLAFVIRALDDLREVRVEATDLRNDAQSIIPADHVDVRVVRSVRVLVDAKAKTYRLQPFLLDKRETFSAPKGKCAQVWLTLKIPETAKPGDYEGTILVRAAGREATQLKLLVKVLPFALPPAPIEMVMFSSGPPASDEILMRELIDAREHGITGFEPSMAVEVKSRDRIFGEDDIAAVRADCKRRMDAVKKVYGGWRFPATFEVGHQIAHYWDQGRNWFAFWPHSKQIDDDFLKAMGIVTDLAKAEGWPPLRVYALDEAGAHNLLDEAVYYHRLIKARMPQLSTLTTIGGGMAMGLDEIGPLSPVVDFLTTNRFTPEIARALVDRGKPYGIYNGCGSTPAGARFFFGFYGWKTGAQQIGQWAYHFGDAVFQTNGFRRDDEGYVYLAPSGPLPSLMWESVREGIDDYRYIYRLSQLIAAAKASNKPAAQSAAKDAAQSLNDLLGNVGWQFQALQTDQRTPPPHPSTLRKWRWKVAQHILALQDAMGSDASTSSAGPRVSPFDFSWTSPEKDESKFGEELLPPSDFEAAMKPWRVESWNGKGSGALDANEHHGGKQSVRIGIPAGSGSDAVTVLVWPKWGGGGLNLVLNADRTYEFSAWVKVKDRSVPPTLRIALPKDATKATRAGQDKPTSDGWQRVWMRVEMDFRAEPNDLAVWVQGPGTVWVDDLSLREVIPPALNLSLDQSEYDGADKVGIATVAIAKHAAPAQVRFVMSRKGGEVIAELAVPFQVQAGVASVPLASKGALTLVTPVDLRTCRFVFDPLTLEPGEYEAKAELLNPQDKPFAAKTVSLQRVKE